MRRNNIIILTISSFNKNDILINGVTKKILDQVASFKDMGLEVKYSGVKNDKLCIFDDNGVQSIAKSTGRAYKDRSKLYNYVIKSINKDNAPTYVYIRHVGSDFSLLRMMKHLKNCGTKVILEFPTYPYFAEKLRNLKGFIGLLLDLICNCFLSKYTTLTTNTNGYTSIFGTKSYNIENAVYIPRFKRYEKKVDDGKIHLIAVSSMAKWHGYDRIINGLKDYKEKGLNKKQVILHLVGDGPELNYYKQLSKQYGLDEFIVFHGSMGGDKLDELFDKCDIGLSSFGLYRIELEKVSTLKVREYCARGIPFAYAYDEQSLYGNEEFAFKLPNNNLPVKIEDLVDFYIRVKNNVNLTNKIREFAKVHFTWEDQFRIMFDKITKEGI